MGFALGNGFLVLEGLEIIFSKCKEERGREAFANLVFYNGFGIPGHHFIEHSAISRSVGWLADSFKIRANNKIIPA